MFAYNESYAQDYYPLKKEEAVCRSWKWYDSVYSPPQNVERAMKCAVSGKFFKLIPKELRFYQKYGLPMPDLHPDERYNQAGFAKSKRNPGI